MAGGAVGSRRAISSRESRRDVISHPVLEIISGTIGANIFIISTDIDLI
jgi:hypothetical protein